MQKNGFIATSLIYSFFLVFIAVMAAILTNYIANKTILLRFNDDAISKLNTKTYDVTLIVHGSEARTGSQRSQAFTNLLYNGDFSSIDDWHQNGDLELSSTHFSKTTSRLFHVSPGSYIFQDVHLVAQQKYYFSIEYSQTETLPLQVYIEPDYSLVTENTNGSWKRDSRTFYATESSDTKPFIIGNSESGYNEVYFTNAMFINLTDLFGVGNEPTAEWMDENIDYFNGTVNYLKESKLKGGSSIEINMVSEERYKKYSVSCISADGNWLESSENVEKDIDTSGKRPKGTINIKNITDDIKCEVWWQEDDK